MDHSIYEDRLRHTKYLRPFSDNIDMGTGNIDIVMHT